MSTTFGIRFSGNEQFYPSNDGAGSAFGWHSYIEKNQAPWQVGGWSYDLPVLTSKYSIEWQAVVASNCGQAGCTYTTYKCWGHDNYVFRGLDGTQYSLPIGLISPDPSNPDQTLFCPTAPNNLKSPGNNHGILSWIDTSSNLLPVTVIDQSGTTYYFPGSASGLASTITDRNGNQILLGSDGQSYHDSTGRSAVSWTGIDGSYNTQPPDDITISGLAGAIAVKWTTTPVSFPESYQNVASGSQCTLDNSYSGSFGEGSPVNIPVVAEIDLPNGQKYTFSYDGIYGKISKITFPDGGYVSYSWDSAVNKNAAVAFGQWVASNGSSNQLYTCQITYDVPAIKERKLSYDGQTVALDQIFSYNTVWNGNVWTYKTTTVNTTDIAGVTSTTEYTNHSATSDSPAFAGSNYSYFTQVPVEATVAYEGGSGGSTYKTVNKVWGNPHLLLAEQTILDNGQSNGSVRCYDSNEQLTNLYEYGFISDGGVYSDPSSCFNSSGTVLTTSDIGGLRRQTTTGYKQFFFPSDGTLNPASWTGTHIVNAPDDVTGVKVADGSGIKAQQALYTYDSGSLQTSPSPVNHAVVGSTRANVTTLKRLISGSTYATTSYQYWDTGQVYSMTDPCGNTTCADMTGSNHTTYYDFHDNYASGTGTPSGQTFAYLTSITDPLGHQRKFSWGYTDGLIRSQLDVNNNLTTSFSYADSLARVTQINYPDGGQTNISYNDSTYSTSTSNPSANTPNMQVSGSHVNKTTMTARDGMGHAVRTMVTSDPQGTIYSDTTYDGFGQVWKQSNPYRISDPTSSPGTTVFGHDVLGRQISVTYPDNSVATTSYSGATTVVTDPSGRQRQSRTGGLGSLVELDEPGYGTSPSTPGTGSVTISGPGEQSKLYTCGPNNQQCTMYDGGTISVVVNGTTYQYGYSQNDTYATVATGLATTMNNGSLVTAIASGSTISITARATGASSNYSLSTSVAWNQNFTNPSFTASPSGSSLTGGANGSTGYSMSTPAVTLYNYNVLGNLTCSVQKSTDTTSFAFPSATSCGTPSATWRPRSFTYDQLSRLLTSSNPETGQITYTYDANGNVSTKTDPRSITITYGFDADNRLSSRSYSNGDPTVTFTYDQSNCLGLSGCKNVGYRTSMTDAAGSESWAYYVGSGTAHQDQRTTNGVTKSSTYYLNLAGDLTQVIYPTGQTVNYTYNAANRPATATDSANGITYATAPASPLSGCPSGAVCYTPQGTVYSMAIGKTASFTGLNVSETFNNRLEPNEITASSTAGNAIDLKYSYADANGHNAGDVYSTTNMLNSARSASFAFDPLDRITSGGTTSTTGQYCWGYLYTPDAWGNVSIASWNSYSNCTQTNASPLSANVYNHIQTHQYDAAGNTTGDGSNSYTWNAEDQTKAVGSNTYTYDGDGRRVAKSSGKLYWYGSGGEVLAETNSSGTAPTQYIFFGGKRVAMLPAGLNAQYYVADSLGSSRVMTTNTGTVCYDADFTPYGGERAYTNNCPTTNAYKFTGKERDTESGNDYFGARYYASTMGRWLSPDWSAKVMPVPYAKLDNPQSLNLYAYVGNNPLIHIDADGHIIDDSGLKDNKDYQKWKTNYLKQKGAQAQWDALNNNKGLTVHMAWTKNGDSVTNGYKWNDAGQLTSVNVTLSKVTGDPSNSLSKESGYIHGSTLNDDSQMRQAYVMAHEFGHVEYAETQAGGASLRQDEQTDQHLHDLYRQFGPNLYPQQPGVGEMQRELDQHHLEREKGADQRAWDVLGDPK
jgi:RHS repeat-associated protein